MDFLPIIEKLLELLHQRRTRKRTDFKQIFDPMFQELLMVHHDYVQAFQELGFILNSEPPIGALAIEAADKSRDLLRWSQFANEEDHEILSPIERELALNSLRVYERAKLQQLRKARDFMRKRMDKFSALRIKLQALASMEIEFTSKEEAAFLRSIGMYFFSGGRPDRDTSFHQTIDWLDTEIRTIIEAVEDTERNIDKLKDELLFIPDLRAEWSQVCEAYAKLKMRVMKA
jgi:hypothetical protein